jgi:hypothetical protein
LVFILLAFVVPITEEKEETKTIKKQQNRLEVISDSMKEK